MGAFQRLPKGRPWGGSRSPWRCWACRPCWVPWWTPALTSTSPCWAFRRCWAWWRRPSTTSTTATRLRSCKSLSQTRRQEWLWKNWFTVGQTATAEFLRQYFHHHHLHPLRLHPQQQQQQQQQLLGTQRAQEEEQRRLQGQLGQEEQALRTTLEPLQSSE